MLTVLAGTLLHFSDGGHQKGAVKGEPLETTVSRFPRAEPSPAHRNNVTLAPVEAEEEAMVDFDWRQVLTNQMAPPKLPREEVEKYLERNARSAASLLAAFGEVCGTNFFG